MVMEIIREGLIITPTGSLEPSQGSYDVPVKLINDETYSDYTINMYIGYYVNGAIKKRKCETDSEGHYLIPGVAFLRSGIISISFLLETADKSQGLMTNALSYEIKHAPNVVVEVPADPTWQELVKGWIQELAGAVNVDNTLTKSGMAADAKATGDAINQLSDSKANITYVDGQIAKAQLEGAGVDTSQFVTQDDLKNINAGLTDAQVNALNEMFKVCAYIKEDVTSEYNAFKTAFGIGESGGDEPDTPINPTVTLTSISATYSGGDVLVGTDVDDLTGITVKGTYSDGTTKNIIDYTLSGNINEGTNTITVSYQGKTTTFTVVGYVEQEEPSEPTEAVYKLASSTTLDGTSGTDTGYVLNDVDKDFSILVEFEPTTVGGDIFDSSKNANLFGPRLQCNGATFGNSYCQINYIDHRSKSKVVITHKKASGTFNIYSINERINYMEKRVLTYDNYATNQHTVGNTITLKIGSKYNGTSNVFSGTIHRFEVYESILPVEEIDTFIGSTWEAPSEPTNLININTCTLGGSMDDGRQISADYYVTDFIPITYGNPYYTNITKYIDESATDSGQYYYLYNSSKIRAGLSVISGGLAMGGNWDFNPAIMEKDEEINYVRLIFHKNYKDIAFFGEGLV